MTVGVGRGGGASRDAEFVEDIAQMAGDRLLTDPQMLSDCPIGSTCRQEPRTSPSRAVSVPVDFLPEPPTSADTRATSGRAPELLKYAAGSLEFLHSAVVIAERLAGETDRDTYTSRLVRHLEFTPQPRRFTERFERGLRIHLGKPDGAFHLSRIRSNQRRIEFRGNRR